MIIIPRACYSVIRCEGEFSKEGYPVYEIVVSDDVIKKLTCNHCGCPVCRHEKNYLRQFHDLIHDRFVVYKLPRVRCCNNDCCHHDGRYEDLENSGLKKYSRGGTHVLFPSFIAPYMYIDATILNDIAKAQLELNKYQCKDNCDSEQFKKIERKSGVFKRLIRRYGDLWLFLRCYLNTSRARRYLRYVRYIHEMFVKCAYRQSKEHYFARQGNQINGWSPHGDHPYTAMLHDLPAVLKIVLSYFAPRLSTYPRWSPRAFWLKVRTCQANST